MTSYDDAAAASERFDARRFAAMIIALPAEARALLEAAYRATGCHAGRVAQAWGVRQSTITDWVARLGMRARLAEIAGEARKAGWHHGRNALGGRPPGAKDARPRPSSKKRSA